MSEPKRATRVNFAATTPLYPVPRTSDQTGQDPVDIADAVGSSGKPGYMIEFHDSPTPHVFVWHKSRPGGKIRVDAPNIRSVEFRWGERPYAALLESEAAADKPAQAVKPTARA